MVLDLEEGVEIGIRVNATVKAPEGEEVEVLEREVTRGVDLVANPDRGDDGIIGFSVECADRAGVTLRVRVRPSRGHTLEDALYATMVAMRGGLNRVTNYLRKDEGLLSFGLDDAPELCAGYPRKGF